MLWFENNEYICQHLGRKQIAHSEWMIKEDLEKRLLTKGMGSVLREVESEMKIFLQDIY